MNNSSESSPVQEGLRLMNHCPICQKDHGGDQTDVVENKEGTKLVHITCPYCKNSIMAVITVSSLGMSSVGIMTDLSAKDTRKLRSRGVITEDELLHFHEFIKKNNFKFNY